MNARRLVARLFALALLALLAAGCATTQVQEQRRFFWPPLPERPRIEWLKAYYSQLDFPKTGFSKVMAGIAGDEEPITFMKPLDIKSDGKGKVYVTDAGTQGVFVYDLVNHDVHVFARENAPGMFKQIISVALDGAGNVYISDAEKNQILVFTADEKPLRGIDLSKHVARAGAIAIDPATNRLYVADTKGHKIAVCGLDGSLQFKIGVRGDVDGAFNFPIDMAVNSKGELVVADAMNPQRIGRRRRAVPSTMIASTDWLGATL